MGDLLRISSRDFYADADMRLAGRVSAALFALGTVFALLIWSAYPPTMQIGDAGWAVAAALVAGIGVTTALSALCKLSPTQLLGTSYLAAAAIAVSQWLSGEMAPFCQLLLIVACYAGAVHPARRVLPLYAVLVAVGAAPLAWAGWSWDVAAMHGACLLLSLGLGAAAMLWTDRTRRLGRRVRDERDRAEQLANTDALTGLGNRRALADRLGGRPLGQTGLLLVDLHDFKSVNERHGHQAGDWLLGSVARELEKAVRRVDACYRWGGDEFLVVIPGGSELVCAEVATRVKDRLALCRKPDGAPLEVSIGEAEAAPGETLDEAIARADRRLLLSKAARGPVPGV